MKLLETDITTKEVLGWKGVHLLHFSGSSCSQKTRIFLNLKGIDWTSHLIDLTTGKNYEPWYLGINPRGLVPTLVHDGNVHIESNDILIYLDETFPEPRLIPTAERDAITAALKEEDDLHLDLRSITMRFVLPKFLVQKKPTEIEAYKNASGIVNGEEDSHKDVELAFWKEYAKQGVTDERVQTAAMNFKSAFDALEQILATQPYLGGDSLTVIDIAWFIYAYRLMVAGYPLARLHPAVFKWFTTLSKKDEFGRELTTPLPLKLITKALHLVQTVRGTGFSKVTGL